MSAEELEAFCQKNNLRSIPDPKAFILEYASNFLVLPKELDPSFYFNFHFPEIKQPFIQALPLSDQKQQLVFDLPPKHQELYRKYFPQTPLICLPLCFAEYVMEHSPKHSHCLIYLHQNLLMVFAAKAGILTYANRFDAGSREAAAYFILSIQQVFDTGSSCSLCTEKEPAEDLQALLEPHFEQIDTYFLDRDLHLFISTPGGQLSI
ncbi:MAG: DUF3822 family protein [Bacteroidales bacterium]|nr:DUF3822 family protein [Bacteroidales bacterium]MDD4640683.1 DUF3822 family protein [Bacteroidales bacterium]